MRILVVEDDERIGAFLERALSSQGHQVELAATGDDGLELARDEAVDFVVLDLSLRGLDGQTVLRELRRDRSTLPVLVLTARDRLDDKVRALDGGADDYLTKPFVLDELLARVRALARRSDQPTSDGITVGPLRLDLRRREVSRGDDTIELTSREFALLEYLMRNAGQLVSREQILAAVWE